MNTKNECWICGLGYGIDNGDMYPGELTLDSEGDLICSVCKKRLAILTAAIIDPSLHLAIGKIGNIVAREEMTK